MIDRRQKKERTKDRERRTIALACVIAIVCNFLILIVLFLMPWKFSLPTSREILTLGMQDNYEAIEDKQRYSYVETLIQSVTKRSSEQKTSSTPKKSLQEIMQEQMPSAPLKKTKNLPASNPSRIKTFNPTWAQPKGVFDPTRSLDGSDDQHFRLAQEALHDSLLEEIKKKSSQKQLPNDGYGEDYSQKIQEVALCRQNLMGDPTYQEEFYHRQEKMRLRRAQGSFWLCHVGNISSIKASQPIEGNLFSRAFFILRPSKGIVLQMSPSSRVPPAKIRFTFCFEGEREDARQFFTHTYSGMNSTEIKSLGLEYQWLDQQGTLQAQDISQIASEPASQRKKKTAGIFSRRKKLAIEEFSSAGADTQDIILWCIRPNELQTFPLNFKEVLSKKPFKSALVLTILMIDEGTKEQEMVNACRQADFLSWKCGGKWALADAHSLAHVLRHMSALHLGLVSTKSSFSVFKAGSGENIEVQTPYENEVEHDFAENFGPLDHFIPNYACAPYENRLQEPARAHSQSNRGNQGSWNIRWHGIVQWGDYDVSLLLRPQEELSKALLDENYERYWSNALQLSSKYHKLDAHLSAKLSRRAWKQRWMNLGAVLDGKKDGS